MKRIAAISSALFLVSLGLNAQNSNSQPMQTIVVEVVCPVGIEARQAAGGDMLAVNQERPRGLAQGIHLILTRRDARRITGAEVTVRGLSGKGRVAQTLSGDAGPSDTEKALDVAFTADTGKEESSFFWVPGMTAVKTIDLVSITYADGGTWRLSSGRACRAVPDSVMRIGGQ